MPHHSATPSKVDLDLRSQAKDRSHEVWIGPGIVSEISSLYLNKSPPKDPPQKGKKAIIIADEKLLKATKSLVKALKAGGWETNVIQVKAGEKLKGIKSVYPLYGRLIEKKADRHSVLFALGGGSIGDTVGFIAATFMRGISWVGVPTTLLAQVDSSVGGKTGINHDAGKNLIGAIYQPDLVVCDPDFLKTLSAREINSGIGEIAKIGIVFDPEFFLFLNKNLGALAARDPEVMSEAIRKSIEWKCRTVARDVEDRTGVRELLNFGHTFGHALESSTGYKIYQHGEAVVWGMRFAVALSEVRGFLSSKDRVAPEALLNAIRVPPLPPNLKLKSLIPLMRKDKKASGGRMRFILLSKVGRTVTDDEVTESDLEVAFSLMEASVTLSRGNHPSGTKYGK